jgi:hypothetical protein
VRKATGPALRRGPLLRRGVRPPFNAECGLLAAALPGGIVWLAGRVVPWHTFNLVGFDLVSFQACHSKYQVAVVRPKRSAFDRRCIDLLSQAL